MHDFGDVVYIHNFIELVVSFPFFARSVEILLDAQALGFLLGSALVIAFQSGLFLFGA